MKSFRVIISRSLFQQDNHYEKPRGWTEKVQPLFLLSTPFPSPHLSFHSKNVFCRPLIHNNSEEKLTQKSTTTTGRKRRGSISSIPFPLSSFSIYAPASFEESFHLLLGGPFLGGREREETEQVSVGGGLF